MKRKFGLILVMFMLIFALSSCDGSLDRQLDASGDRYFTTTKSKAEMINESQNISKKKVKELLKVQVDVHWSLLQSTFNFGNKDQACAFLMGMATRESTLQGGLETSGSQVETGFNPSHAFGALQAAEPAYVNDKGYTPEKDVPEMTQYKLENKNFYDPGVAIHMGIRHLVHFALAAKKINKNGNDLLRYSLIGYNKGHVDEPVSDNWMKEYADEIGALAGWYLKEKHLTDDIFTWTGDPRVDRSNPWGWYK